MAETKKKLAKLNTPIGEARWCWLYEPDTRFKDDGEYRVDLILNAENPKVKEIVAKIKATYDDFKATLDDPKKAKKEPKHLGFEPETDDNGDETGNLIFKFKAKATFVNKKGERVEKTPPAVFDSKLKQIKEPISIYNGTTMIVNFSPSGYFNGTNNGVTLYLNAVQIINLVSGGNGDAKDYGFGEEEGYSSTPSMDADDDTDEGEVNDEDF